MAQEAPNSFPATQPTLDAKTMFLTTVAAFSCLIKPTRNEIVRIDALLMPIYDHLDAPTKRIVATKLAMSADLPPKMAMRLCLEPLEIAAPLLMTKAHLAEDLLLRSIAKNGNGHLNIIAKRNNLPASIEALMKNRVQPIALKKETLEAQVQIVKTEDTKPEQPISSGLISKSKADSLREELRGFMEKTALPVNDSARTISQPTQKTVSFMPPSLSPATNEIDTLDHQKLVRYAIDGEVGLFATRVSDCLGVGHNRVRRIIAQSSYSELLICLRALYCDSVTAFAICAPLFPQGLLGDTAAIQLFHRRSDAISVAQAHQTLQDWRLSEAPLKRAEHTNRDDISSSEAIFAQLSSAS